MKNGRKRKIDLGEFFFLYFLPSLVVLLTISGMLLFMFKQEWIIVLCFVIPISIFFYDYCTYDKRNDIDKKYKIIKDKDALSPMLGTINETGGTFILTRIDIQTGHCIYYNFIEIFGMPLIYLGTYLADEVASDSWRKKNYKIYAEITASWVDILHFYISWIGALVTFVFMIFTIYGFGDLFGWW